MELKKVTLLKAYIEDIEARERQKEALQQEIERIYRNAMSDGIDQHALREVIKNRNDERLNTAWALEGCSI